jgi:hypothetical protein
MKRLRSIYLCLVSYEGGLRLPHLSHVAWRQSYDRLIMHVYQNCQEACSNMRHTNWCSHWQLNVAFMWQYSRHVTRLMRSLSSLNSVSNLWVRVMMKQWHQWLWYRIISWICGSDSGGLYRREVWRKSDVSEEHTVHDQKFSCRKIKLSKEPSEVDGKQSYWFLSWLNIRHRKRKICVFFEPSGFV